MRQSYYLQTDTQQATIDALTAAGLMDTGGNPIGCDIAWLGPLFFADGTSDLRYHTNLLTHDPLTPEQQGALPLVHPADPVCVWA
jgi:hypothetical protein